MNNYAQIALNDEKIIKKMQNQLKTISKTELNSYQKETKKANKRLLELDNIISSLYEDKVLKRITERSFEKMSEKYQTEQKQLLDRLDIINKEIEEQDKKEQGAVDFIKLVKQYNGITELTSKIVNELIDKIEVSERYINENGEMQQDIKIFYKFVGTLEDINYKVEKLKPLLTEREIVCQECGKLVKTTANNRKYCDECGIIVHRRQGAEGKKRSRERQKILKQQIPKTA